MTFTIEQFWWLIPTVVSIAAIRWCARQDYRGDYNFTALFTIPVTAFVIAFAWMLYFGIGWVLA